MRTFFLGLALTAASALAQGSDDLDALQLADQAQSVPASASDWHSFVEVALGLAAPQHGPTLARQRLSFDLQFDQRFAPEWRAVFSDRLDLNRQQQPGQASVDKDVNTIRDAYLSWQPQAHQLLDAGRINVPYGAASGYNPSDYFRDYAVRSAVSVDPSSLKKNRMGSVMLRGQQLWDSGSLTALYSPQLAQQANAGSYHPDLGATNAQDRWLIAYSQKLPSSMAGQLTPQWLLQGGAHAHPQIGMNLSALLNDASVAYLEYSGGRSRSMLSQAVQGKDDSAFRNRLASGITYTTANKLSLTLEYEYSGSALDDQAWDALRKGIKQGAPLPYLQYRQWQQNQQELTTRQEIFVYASWPDALLQHLDLSAMQKLNLADHSRLSWLEARYHLEKLDLALQWQRNSGEASSAYGAALQKYSWQAQLRVYF
ncbi:hypothetical protein [Undibacterium sp.]|uniref:hypothetical protein n=1 Tax=Undibacterium sp. TaxID=1914977 RepID=UPI0025E28FD8|nr:hypothetical protein [Undibacterium sp.]